jgi:leucyl-tRNA synthetase
MLRPYIQASLKFQECDIVKSAGELSTASQEGWSQEKADTSEPGSPAIQFWNV